MSLKRKAIRCFKASVNIFQSGQRNVLEDLKFLLLLSLFEFVFCQNILGLLMQIPYTLYLSDVPHCCASSPCCQLLALMFYLLYGHVCGLVSYDISRVVYCCSSPNPSSYKMCALPPFCYHTLCTKRVPYQNLHIFSKSVSRS